MYNKESSPTLVNVTFTGNTATQPSGAIHNDASSTPVLRNSILWGNGATPISGPADIAFSIVEGGATGTGNLNADPLFLRNPSPGADALWATADDDYGDLRLTGNSPAIDAGANASVPGDVTTDITGGPRIVGQTVDMGAYEYAPPAEGSAPLQAIASESQQTTTTAPAVQTVLATTTDTNPTSVQAVDRAILPATGHAQQMMPHALADAGPVLQTQGDQLPLASDLAAPLADTNIASFILSSADHDELMPAIAAAPAYDQKDDVQIGLGSATVFCDIGGLGTDNDPVAYDDRDTLAWIEGLLA